MQITHNIHPRQWMVLPIVCLLLAFSCQKKGRNAEAVQDALGAEADLLLVVTVAPYKYLLREITGDGPEIFNTSEFSADPHTVDLTPQQAVRLKKAAVFFSIQPEEERLLLRSLGEQTKIVELWQGFPLLQARHDHQDAHAEEHEEEDHEEEHDETEKGWDEHFWLSPTALKVQIQTMAAEMAALLPQQKNEIEANAKALLERCDTLAASLRSSLPALQNGRILSFHSALAYFADFFNAQEIFIESKGIELGSEEMLHLFEDVQNLSYPVFIYQPQFEQEKARTLAGQLELKLLEFDPLREDVFANLLSLAERLNQTSR